MPHPDHATAVPGPRGDAAPCAGYAGALDLAAALIERTTRHLRARTLRADVARDLAALRRMLVAGEDGHVAELTIATATGQCE